MEEGAGTAWHTPRKIQVGMKTSLHSYTYVLTQITQYRILQSPPQPLFPSPYSPPHTGLPHLLCLIHGDNVIWPQGIHIPNEQHHVAIARPCT